MSEKPTAEEIALWQRRLASQANNRAWTLAEQPSRTADEDEEMLQAAHAAMHFWRIVGNERNRAHAALLVAHAYALLKLPDPASYYLAQSQPLLLSDQAMPWERAMAHAVAANVAAAKGDHPAHRLHYRTAAELAAALPDQDRSVVQTTLRVIPAPTA
jgi:xanthosine utilization system XapX-like protein